MKKCKECGIEKELSDFWKNKRMTSGYFNKCKICSKREKDKYAAEHVDEMRATRSRYSKLSYKTGRKGRDNKIYKLNNPLVVKAHSAVRYAVRMGKIIKPKNCSTCNEETSLHGHHNDYTKLLDVIWLCPSCHGQLHHKLKNNNNTQTI
jgi:hypothetical protein